MGKPSNNPFMLYMHFRRKEFEQNGRLFPGGWKEVADLVSEDWTNMSLEEKDHWKLMAQMSKEGSIPDPISRHSADGMEYMFGFQTEFDLESGPASRQRNKVLNVGRDKFVLQFYSVREVLIQIKSRFLKLVQDYPKLESTGFCFILFTWYDKGEHPFTLDPAEFAIAKWSLMDGIRVFQTSLIDTHKRCKNEIDTRGKRRNEWLGVPPPDYTYERGLAYSAGEDDYGKILNIICQNAVSITDSEGIKWKYVFTPRKFCETVQECLGWFMYKCDVNVRIRVFPLEPILQELFRCAATIRKFRERGFGHLCQDSQARLNVKLSPEDYEFIMEKGTEDFVNSYVIGPHYHDLQNWDCWLRFACNWHLKKPNEAGILDCPAKHVRKWTCLTLFEVSRILERQPGPWIQFFNIPDIETHPWTMRDAMGIEMRQRLGLEQISVKRRAILEDRFVFPSLLSVLRQKYPRGLLQQPEEIIWPVDRDIEKDLNYSKEASFVICDYNRKITLEKREQKRLRDAEEKRLLEELDQAWGKAEKFNIT